MLTHRELSELSGLEEDAFRETLARAAAREGVPLPAGPNRRYDHALTRRLLHCAGRLRPVRKATIGMEKGGVGKSFLTVNTALALAERGRRVLVIDLDPEACATNFLLPEDADYRTLATMLEIYASETLTFAGAAVRSRHPGVDVVACKPKARRVHRFLAGRNPRKTLAERLGHVEGYDLVLFEVPPTFGEAVAGAYLASDIVVMPVVPDIWSIESLDLTLQDIHEECRMFDAPVPEIRILVNRHARTRTASREALEHIRALHGHMVLPDIVPEAAPVQNAINEGLGIFQMRCPAEVRAAVLALGELLAPLAAAQTEPVGTGIMATAGAEPVVLDLDATATGAHPAPVVIEGIDRHAAPTPSQTGVSDAEAMGSEDFPLPFRRLSATL